MPLTQSTAPTTEPVDLADAKQQLRISHTDEDDLIEELAIAAREQVEMFTRRQLITGTWTLTLDDWPSGNEIILPNPPLQSVTSVAYTDTAGSAQTWSSDEYSVDTAREPGRVTADYSYSFPTNRGHTNDITVIYVAGYGDAASDVPARARQAIKLLMADMYEHREARSEIKVEDNPTVQRLLWGLRIETFAEHVG